MKAITGSFTAGEGARPAIRQPLDHLSETYLNGQWPREPYQSQRSVMSDKTTQTPGCWRGDGGELKTHKLSTSWGCADHLTEISKLRQQLRFSLRNHRRRKEDVTSTLLNQPVMSSCTDCIDQELENVFVCKNWGRREEKVLEVCDGGRAPVPPPHLTDLQISCSLNMENDDKNGSPASLEPNHSFTFNREPPEGCEKIKVFEDIVTCRTQGFPVFSCPDRIKVNFCPSASAFCPVRTQLLCSSFFPAQRAASSSSLDNLTAGQTSASAQNSVCPVRPERCRIRKCLMLS